MLSPEVAERAAKRAAAVNPRSKKEPEPEKATTATTKEQPSRAARRAAAVNPKPKLSDLPEPAAQQPTQPLTSAQIRAMRANGQPVPRANLSRTARTMTFSITNSEFRPLGLVQGLDRFSATLVTEGVWAHPSGAYKVAATRQSMRWWVQKFDQLKAAGNATFVPVGHSTNPLANAGFVESMEVVDVGGKAALRGVLDIRDADVAKKIREGTITGLSIGVEPDATISRADGSVERLGEAIQHVALTLVPVVGTAGQFVQIPQH